MASGQGGSGVTLSEAMLSLPVDQFLNLLDRKDQVLIELKDKLYEGRWEDLLADLEARYQGRPYIFKLSQVLEKDIQTVKVLQRYEELNRVDLAKVLAERKLGLAGT